MWATTKYVSDTWITTGMTASMIPLIPPSVNIVMKPSANSIGVRRWITPRHSVASQEKILIPVGTAISIVVIIIGTRSHENIPDTNMWWAQTVNPRITIATSEKAIIRYPKIGFRALAETTSLMIPKPGSIMM